MYQLRTEGDYDFGEVLSALQKSIRRGHEVEAMYWALELYVKYRRALWQRLTVVANEDIGVSGNPMAIILIQTLKTQFEEFAKAGRDGSMRLVLANAILYLCRSPKSRESDHFQCCINQRRLQQNWRLPVPDYALDKHTGRGARMKRSWDQWFREGCQLIPEPPENAYKEEAQRLWPTMKKTKKAKPPKDESPLFPESDE
jgi:replication-associated recombination protein RarA